MEPPANTPEEHYAAVAEALLRHSEVTRSERRGFGSSGLWTNGKIFAFLSKGRLVVKLPRQRVDALVASGEGGRFDPGHGRLMKEWLATTPVSREEWLRLATEAMEFVGSRR
ncbi:MAG TPA: TfoX/Sxy family protein [Candidatus Dormibacteraeota bacterium]|jgi:TfoX/Sxy family transcriptional regulator of competence genes